MREDIIKIQDINPKWHISDLIDRSIYIDTKNKICIKVPKNKYSEFWTKREFSFYNSIKNTNLINNFSKPIGKIRCMGNDKTGYSYELIQHNNVSLSLPLYIKKYGKSNILNKKYKELIEKIYNNNLILISTFKLKDILIKNINENIIQLVMIDYETVLNVNPKLFKFIRRLQRKNMLNLYDNI